MNGKKVKKHMLYIYPNTLQILFYGIQTTFKKLLNAAKTVTLAVPLNLNI